MPEDSDSPQPETPKRSGQRRTGAAFAGETTRPQSDQPIGEDETVLSSREVIGDFEVLGKLGQGGMGAVYRARQMSLDRQVALKILPTNLEADADFVARFQREARVAASLSHANLVKVYSSGVAGGCHYIAMELIEGETLGDFVKRGPLPIPDALRICLDVARALQHGWNRAQLIHRDIKPGNIFLSQNGEVKLGDLGLAKSMASDTTGLTQTGTAMGTPHYISPEQAKGDKDLDYRADIYSLGCTLYQMLTGKTPYEGRDPLTVMNMHINAPIPAILKVMPQCPIPLARLVGKMLKKAKRERQSSYEELIAEIERVQAIFAPAKSELESLPPDPDATLIQTTEPPVSQSPPLAQKSKLPLYAVVAAGVLVFAVIAIVMWPKEEKLTQAQLAMKQREAEKKTITPIPEPSGSNAVAASAPKPVKLWSSPEEVAGKDGITWEDNAAKVSKGSLTYRLPVDGNGIIRTQIRANPDSWGAEIAMTGSDGKHRLVYIPATQKLEFKQGDPEQRLGEWKLPRRFTSDEYIPIELKLIANNLKVSVEGQVLGSVNLGGAGKIDSFTLFAHKNGYFRDVEYVLLDAVTTGSNTEPWQDMLRDPTKLKLSGNVERTSDGLRLNGNGVVYILDGKTPSANGRVRAQISGMGLRLRARQKDGAGFYWLSRERDDAVVLARYDNLAGKSTTLQEFALRKPVQESEDYELEMDAPSLF